MLNRSQTHGSEHDAKQEPAVAPDHGPAGRCVAGEGGQGEEGGQENGKEARLQKLRLHPVRAGGCEGGCEVWTCEEYARMTSL